MGKNIDSKTYGDSPAAIVLADKITGNAKLIRKVGRILTQYYAEMNALAPVELEFKISFGYLIFEKHRARCVVLPEIIGTYTDNVLSTHFKIWVKTKKEQLKARKK